MAKVLVEIDLGESVTTRDIRLCEDFIELRKDGEYIIIDEAYLTRAEDDSFFEFKLIEMRDGG